MQQYNKMIKKLFLDDVTKENTKKRNPNWSQISDHTYRILTIGDSESWKRNSLFNPICQCGGGAEGVGGCNLCSQRIRLFAVGASGI